MKSTYIIAEAGVNHNGKLDLALRLVEEAKKANADCVKFQTFKASNLVTLNAPKADYQLKDMEIGNKSANIIAASTPNILCASKVACAAFSGFLKKSRLDRSPLTR